MPSLFGSKRFRDLSLKSPTDGHASQASGSGVMLSPTSQASSRDTAPNSPFSPYVPQEKVEKVVRDLWSEAFASLPENDQLTLRPADQDGTPGDRSAQLAAVEKVMELTEVKYKEYCKRGWHTRRGDTTKETNIKIKAKEVMCAALQFDDIVKAGLKFDPSGYGMTVWGVLSGVMTLVQNDKNRADAVFDSAAVLARYLPKYAIIEDHYRDRKTQEQKAFEDQIKNVYTSILRFAACVQKELNISLAGRLLESFWTLDNQNIKTLKDELKSNDQIVTEQSRYVAHQYRRQEFQKLDAQALEALNKIDFAVQKLLEAEKLRTLKWLSDSPLTDKQQQLRSKVEKLNENSGQWLLESGEYETWLSSEHSFLWLHGTSGCGKSMLCSTVIKSLMESAAEDSNILAAHWYFDNADSQTQNFQRLLRLILRQIAAHATPFPEPVRDLADRHEAAGSLPGTTALIKTLQETVAGLYEDFFLVLDAIDEYQAENETLREEFLDFLVQLGGARLPKLHILVTSISEPDIENAFRRLRPHAADMDVERPVSVDVDAYLDLTVERYATEKHWSPDITTKILKALKEDGRFRIVSLQLEDLRKCYDDREIDEALESIPHSIEDAYIRTLRAVAPKDVRRLRYIFYWISVAARHLTAFELMAAPGVDLANIEDLFDICPGNMIRLEKQEPYDGDRTSLSQQSSHNSSRTETDVVTFDHPSVKRFLYSPKLEHSVNDRLSPFFVSEKTVNAEVAGLMVDHLLAIEQPRITPQIVEMAPFLPYAARYWHKHLKDAGNILDEDEALNSKLSTLFGDPMCPAYLNWIRLWDPERQRADLDLFEDNCPSPLYMAVFLRLQGISRSLIDQGSYINGTGGLMHKTTLQLASEREEIEISQMLIESGEDIDTASDGQPPALYIAVYNRNTKLVQILLEAGADPDRQDFSGSSILQLASFRGLTGIVESLVASGADVNLQGGPFGTALQAAATAGHTDILKTLLGKGATPDAVGGLLGTAIQAAETGGHSVAVKLLAAQGIPWDEEGDSVWHEAYDLWISQTPKTRVAQFFLTAEPLQGGSQAQRLLAGVLKVLTPPPPDANRMSHSRRKSAGPVQEAERTDSLKMTELVRRRGQGGTETKNYVYRAFFWAFLLDCKTRAQELSDRNMEMAAQLGRELDRFIISVVQLASSQKAIEHGTSDDVLAARHEMVKCYVLAFEVVSQSSQQLKKRSRFFLFKQMQGSRWEFMDGFDRQVERFESVMRLARLQGPSETDTVSKLHDELFKKTQQEIRVGMQTLEEGMQKRLEDLEHRVVQSVQDILPGIIREEMRKLLAEQREPANT